MEFSVESLKKIRTEINNIDENKQFEIIKILISNNCKYTINKNGFFINLNLVKPDVINEILEYLEFSKKNNIIIENLINERNKQIIKID